MKTDRLRASGFALSCKDRKIIVFGQLLTTLASAHDAANFAALADGELARDAENSPTRPEQVCALGEDIADRKRRMPWLFAA